MSEIESIIQEEGFRIRHFHQQEEFICEIQKSIIFLKRTHLESIIGIPPAFLH